MKGIDFFFRGGVFGSFIGAESLEPWETKTPPTRMELGLGDLI